MRFACALFFFGIWALSCALINRSWEIEQQEKLDENCRVLATTYRASVDMYRLTTDILFKDVIQRPEVLSTFASGVLGDKPASDLARGKLYRLLSPTFEHLKQQGIQQFHFHTAGGESFLRFHAPETYGDHLFDTRPSVREANEKKRAVFSFESGRVGPGFRYVFPLFLKEQHLGSVETGVSFRSISAAMANLDPGCEYLLVLNKGKLLKTLLEDRRPLFSASPISDDFLVENSSLGLPTSSPRLTANVQDLNAKLKNDPLVKDGLTTGQPFSLAITTEMGCWAVAFYPVRNLPGEAIAYVVSYSRAPFFDGLRKRLIFNLSATTFGVAGLFWLTMRLLQSHIRLRNEKQHLQIITNTMADGLCVMDLEGRILQINPAFSEVLGFREAEVIGRVGHDIFHAHEGGANNCPLLSAINRGVGYSGEELFRHKSGRVVAVELASKPFVKESRIVGSVTAFHDITDRKLAERELKDSRDRLAQLAEQSRTIVWEVDTRGVYTYVSPVCEKVIGYRSEEVVGCFNYFDFHSDEGRKEFEDKAFGDFVRHEQFVNLVKLVKSKDGHEIWLSCNGMPIIDANGDFLGYRGSDMDITVQKGLEYQNMRAAQLAAIGELASGVAHEINNPVTGVINYAQILLNRLHLGDKDREIVERIVKEGNRIASIVRDLLFFSRDSGKQKSVEVAQKLLLESLSLARKQMDKDGIELVLDFEEPPMEILVNPQQIEQVWLNLVSNARHALNERHGQNQGGKELRIAMQRIDLQGRPYCRTIFLDNGTGIPEKVIDQVFRPFFTTKPAGVGTGLGLSISREIVTSFAGELLISSREREFTKVTIDLPLVAKQGVCSRNPGDLG